MLKDIAKLVALAVVEAVTTVMTVMAIYSRGALIYYYEPNRLVLATEIVLGLFSVIVCAGMIIVILEEMRS